MLHGARGFSNAATLQSHLDEYWFRQYFGQHRNVPLLFHHLMLAVGQYQIMFNPAEAVTKKKSVEKAAPQADESVVEPHSHKAVEVRIETDCDNTANEDLGGRCTSGERGTLNTDPINIDLGHANSFCFDTLENGVANDLVTVSYLHADSALTTGNEFAVFLRNLHIKLWINRVIL